MVFGRKKVPFPALVMVLNPKPCGVVQVETELYDISR